MSGRTIRFGRFRFDAVRDLLYKDGQPVALGSKAATLLRVLLDARGDVVAKSDLMDAAWPSPNAEESNLTVQIAALRRCLGDDSRRPEWIETFHRVGYRFAGEVQIEEYRTPPSGHALRMVPDRPAVALLPFEMEDRAILHPHIVDGMVDNLVIELSRLPVSLTTAGRDASLAQFPEGIFGFDYSIKGRVGVTQGRLRVKVMLDEPLSRTGSGDESVFEGALADLFRFQVEVARKIASLLKARLPEKPAESLRGLDDTAYGHYRRGCDLLVRSYSGNRSARRLLARAVELDPGFAKAFAFLGVAHFGAAQHYGEQVTTNHSLALAYARRAISLDPEEPAAYGALGFVKLYEGDLAEAEDRFQTARHYSPGDTYILMNMTELRVLQNRHDDAVAHAREAIRLSGTPPGWYFWDLAFACYAAGLYSEAVEALQRPEVERLPGKRLLAASLAQLGDVREARVEAARFLAANPEFAVSHWAQTQPFVRVEDRRHFVDGFLKAGFPH